MAGSMQDIDRRIKSVTSTRQITHAMQLVATAKLRRTRERAEARKAYTDYMISCMHMIAGSLKGESQNAFLSNNGCGKDLYIVVTADKGLAGGFNSNLLKFASLNMDQNSDSQKAVIAVGKKAVEYFTRNKTEIMGSYVGESDKPEYPLAREIGRVISTLFIDKKVDNIYIVYNRFVSVMSQQPVIIKLAPLTDVELSDIRDNIETGLVEDKTDKNDKFKDFATAMSFDPSAEEIADWLIPSYLVNAVYGALLDSGAGELAARRFAMENATDNADEILSDLTLEYNRVRQGAITQEITEIISGADALS